MAPLHQRGRPRRIRHLQQCCIHWKETPKQHGNIAVDSRSSAQNRFPRLKKGAAPTAEDPNTGRSATSASVACLTSDRVVHRSQPHERYRCHDLPYKTPTDASRGRITRCGCDSRNLHHPVLVELPVFAFVERLSPPTFFAVCGCPALATKTRLNHRRLQHAIWGVPAWLHRLFETTRR